MNCINNSQFRKLSFYAHKIHGARSYVEFKYRDKPTTKELADMVVISLATYKRRRIFQKITFIQNKKDTNKKWKIDEEQLFLLKNFPDISGNRGLLKSFSSDEIVFLNHSRCLGSFGLLMNPGEMIFLSAPLLEEMRKNDQISLEEIMYVDQFIKLPHNFNPLILDFIRRYPDSDKYYHNLSRIYYLSSLYESNIFLSNSVFSRDIYDFIRNWTLFNIGEPTYLFGRNINQDLDRFSNLLLRTIGLQEHVDLNDNYEGKVENELAVFVMHLDLSKE